MFTSCFMTVLMPFTKAITLWGVFKLPVPFTYENAHEQSFLSISLNIKKKKLK